MSEGSSAQAAVLAVAADDYLARYEQRTPGSKALYDKARQVTPGGISHNPRHHAPYPIYFQKAKGCTLWDVDGNQYIDLWMAHYDAILGHAPEGAVKLLQEAMEGGLHVGLAMEHEVGLAERVVDMVPAAEQVRFCASGTEATMYAVRLARGFTGKNIILKIRGGWHGANTDLMVDVFGPEFIGPEGAGLLPHLTDYTRAVEFNDIEDTARAIRDAGSDWAGIILEPAVGSAGFLPVEQEYLAFLKEEAAKAGSLIIFDEIITGFRLGAGGAQEYFDFTPDLATFGKVMGGGMPIGAIAGREDIMSLSSVERKVPKAEKLIIGGGTYSTNPLSMISGMATLDTLKADKDKIYPTIAERNAKFCDGVREAFTAVGIPVFISQVGSLQELHFLKEAGLPVRNMGELLNNTYSEKRAELAGRLRNHGVFLFHGGAISMAHEDQHIETLIAAYSRCAQEMAEGS
jgi:glutamate-1-semialdehyde 2,1-aminomutase